jgi:hypothetical protein
MTTVQQYIKNWISIRQAIGAAIFITYFVYFDLLRFIMLFGSLLDLKNSARFLQMLNNLEARCILSE